MNYLIYDLEIIKCIPDRGARFEGYEYCNGWHDHAGMGISVIGWATEYSNGCFQFADKPTMLTELAKDKVIVGFNSKNFDDKLCSANGMYIRTHYDLLEEIRIAAYGSPDYRDAPPGYSYALGKVGEANGLPKTGSGELAPQIWQQGRFAEVEEYCLNDVIITQNLMFLGLAGRLKDPNTGRLLHLRPLPQL